MSSPDALSPREAAYIANNSYFTLKGWIDAQPVVGMETRARVKDAVLGSGRSTQTFGGAPANTSLKQTSLAGADLRRVFAGTTGMGTNTGFGYILRFDRGGSKHVIIATRGTRAEIGAADLLTDLYAARTGFGDYGQVHKGFKLTFDSVMANIVRDVKMVMDADVVHCVGHSLGGAVATLVAAHFSAQGKAVRLYTFGSPRVGAYDTYLAMHRRIGKENIYRVAHDLDPISLIGPYPYIHVNPSFQDPNNMTLYSPTGKLLSVANHNMLEYVNSVSGPDGFGTWEAVRAMTGRVDHDNSVLGRWLLHDPASAGWLRKASAYTLGLLLKLFADELRKTSAELISAVTAIDLVAQMAMRGLHQLEAMAPGLFKVLSLFAQWAGDVVGSAAQMSMRVIRRILETMMATITPMAVLAAMQVSQGLIAMPLALAGASALVGVQI
jgi:pimeloyl-ACP methyl ester carboxylesterase